MLAYTSHPFSQNVLLCYATFISIESPMLPYVATYQMYANCFIRAPFDGLILIPEWISNYNHYEVWYEITNPFPKFNGTTFEVWDWIGNFIPHCVMDVITSISWLAVFSSGYSFLLAMGSCVSEPPHRGFLCVRKRDTLNLFLEWEKPLKMWPHFKQKIGYRLLAYIICTKDYITNLATSSKIQNLIGHMTPLSCHCHMTSPLWLLGYQVII